MPDIFNPFLFIHNIRDFLELGGAILWLLLCFSFLLWAVALYYWSYLHYVSRGLRLPHYSGAYALWQRRKYVSDMIMLPRQLMAWLKLMVKLAPLLGLLGTVTGMVYVFDVIAISGTSNARALAQGIARATLPTMTAMAIAVMGLFFIYILEQRTSALMARLNAFYDDNHRGGI